MALSFAPIDGLGQVGRAATGYIRTNWSRDPFSYGSYSFLARVAWRRDHTALARPVADRLFFAGEATHPRFNSTVHAAYESGLIAAEAIFETQAKTVGVIGAGMSGLAAADALHRQGYTVTVLEARDRVGGRIWTDTSLGAPLDLGASWIHGIDGNPLVTLAEKVAAKTQATTDSFIMRGGDGREMEVAETPRWLDEVLSVQHSAGARLSDINTWAYWRDSDYSGVDVVFPGGYAQLFDAFSKKMDIQLGRMVNEVILDGARVRLKGKAGLDQAFDAVIVTVPLGVLKHGAIAFDPPLPSDKQAAIAALGMGLLDKIYLRYDDVFWDRDVTWIATPENGLPQGQFNQWLNLYPYTGEPVIMAFNGAQPARDLATLADAELVARAQQTLNSAYPGERQR